MGVEVRPARVADIEGVQGVARQAWHAAHGPIVGAEAVETFLDEHYDGESFRRLLDGEAVFAVADGADGDVVGFVTAHPADDPETFALGRLYVEPDRWGEGVGRRLLDHAERAAAGRGGTRIELGVVAENDRAVGFYETAGYRRDGEFHDDRIDARGYEYAKHLE